MVSSRTFTRTAPIQFFGWLCRRDGFGACLHQIAGVPTRDTHVEATRRLGELIDLVQTRRSAVYVDTLVAPNSELAIAIALQLPGVSGMENISGPR